MKSLFFLAAKSQHSVDNNHKKENGEGKKAFSVQYQFNGCVESQNDGKKAGCSQKACRDTRFFDFLYQKK